MGTTTVLTDPEPLATAVLIEPEPRAAPKISEPKPPTMLQRERRTLSNQPDQTARHRRQNILHMADILPHHADAPGMNRTCARGLGNRCSIH